MFLLLLANLTPSLKAKSACIFGLLVTFNLAGLFVIVEVVDEECQKSQTSL